MVSKGQTVIIVGGGIAGLSLAYYLEEGGKKRGCPFTIILVEKDNRLGGKILTEVKEGFVIEGGPDAVLAQKSAGINLFEKLRLAEEIIGVSLNAKTTYLLVNGMLHKLPPGFTGLLPVNPFDLFNASFLSLPGKIRMALEPIIPRRQVAYSKVASKANDDESIASFCSRRFGKEAYLKFLEPLMGGVFAGDAETLSLKGTFPRFMELEKKYGSLFRGLRKGRGKSNLASYGKRPQSPFVTIASGLGKLIERLKESIKSVIFLPKTVAIRMRPHGMLEGKPTQYALLLSDGKEIYGDAIILAVPAYEAAKIIEPLDIVTSKELDNIPYASTSTISLGYRKIDIPFPMDGTGYLVPKIEKRQIMAVTWTSSKWENRAPEYGALLRCYVGRMGEEAWLTKEDDELVAICREELKNSMGIKAKPILEQVNRWKRSMPQYLVGHMKRIDFIMERLKGFPGLYLIGSGFNGVGIPDCISDGEETAKKILSYLTTQVTAVEDEYQL